MRVYVCDAGDLAPGESKVVDVDGRSVGVFRVGGGFVAYLNLCPHELAPVCAGKVTGTNLPTETVGEFRWSREGEVLKCPWHGWEFDLVDGRCLVDRCRLLKYPVVVEDGKVYIAGRR